MNPQNIPNMISHDSSRNCFKNFGPEIASALKSIKDIILGKFNVTKRICKISICTRGFLIKFLFKKIYFLKVFSPRKATRLALGNPENKLHLPTITDEFVFPVKIPEWSIWNLNYKNILERKEEEEELILEERFGAFKVFN